MISDILLSLEAERDRIELAMKILRGNVSVDVLLGLDHRCDSCAVTMAASPAAVAEAFTSPPVDTMKPSKRKPWTPARKQAHAIRMKKMWAKRRKASRRGEAAEG